MSTPKHPNIRVMRSDDIDALYKRVLSAIQKHAALPKDPVSDQDVRAFLVAWRSGERQGGDIDMFTEICSRFVHLRKGR